MPTQFAPTTWFRQVSSWDLAGSGSTRSAIPIVRGWTRPEHPWAYSRNSCDTRMFRPPWTSMASEAGRPSNLWRAEMLPGTGEVVFTWRQLEEFEAGAYALEMPEHCAVRAGRKTRVLVRIPSIMKVHPFAVHNVNSPPPWFGSILFSDCLPAWCRFLRTL